MLLVRPSGVSTQGAFTYLKTLEMDPRTSWPVYFTALQQVPKHKYIGTIVRKAVLCKHGANGRGCIEPNCRFGHRRDLVDLTDQLRHNLGLGKYRPSAHSSNTALPDYTEAKTLTPPAPSYSQQPQAQLLQDHVVYVPVPVYPVYVTRGRLVLPLSPYGGPYPPIFHFPPAPPVFSPPPPPYASPVPFAASSRPPLAAPNGHQAPSAPPIPQPTIRIETLADPLAAAKETAESCADAILNGSD